MWLHVRSKTKNQKYKMAEVMIDATRIIVLDIGEFKEENLFGLKIMTHKYNFMEHYDSLEETKERMAYIMNYSARVSNKRIHVLDEIKEIVNAYDHTVNGEEACPHCSSDPEHESEVNKDTFIKIIAEMNGERI